MLVVLVNSVDDFVDLPGIKMLFRCGLFCLDLVCYLVLAGCFWFGHFVSCLLASDCASAF